MHSKRKIPDSWQPGWKAKACTSLALYLRVFKNYLYIYLRHVRVLSIKPCSHTQLPVNNRNYWKVSWGWGHLIIWNGSMMGHVNSFLASGGGNLNKNFPKIQMPGGLPGGRMLKLRFDWYIRPRKCGDQPYRLQDLAKSDLTSLPAGKITPKRHNSKAKA